MVGFGDVVAGVAPDAAVGLVRYRVSGWNGVSADPASDVKNMLDTAPDRFGRIVLIGHSMGGRAVLRAASHPRVEGVLALAPWVPDEEPALGPCEAPVVIATGTGDETTPVAAARRFVALSRIGGCRLGYFEIPGAGHRLLAHAQVADHVIRSFLAQTLGDGDDLIASSISADADRPPDFVPTPGDRWRFSGPSDNVLSVLAWKGRRRSHML
jgi:pimeloyl-ACP methyl ester carboxylesterase